MEDFLWYLLGSVNLMIVISAEDDGFILTCLNPCGEDNIYRVEVIGEVIIFIVEKEEDSTP